MVVFLYVSFAFVSHFADMYVSYVAFIIFVYVHIIETSLA